MCEASLCDLRGHRGRALTEGLGRFASQSLPRAVGEGGGERSEQRGGPSERRELTAGVLAVAAEEGRDCEIL